SIGMRTIVHLSDVHFGRVDAAIVAPLVDTIRAIAPDLVAVSGDLTQRARRAQFRAARAFLDRLPVPQLVVPGNHDVPLFNLPAGHGDQDLIGRSTMAMPELAAAGADLFLAGHLHVSHIGHTAERYKIAGHSALVVQAGTLSTRGRGELNAFNVLRLDRPRIT